MSTIKMEEVNLAQLSLGTTVTSDTVSSSSTPLECLLTPGPRHWMADSFIRPPVSLTLHLPVPVRLARLSWDTRMGSQASSFFEVLVTTELSALAGGSGGHTGQLRAGRGEARDGRIEFRNPRLVTWTDSGAAHMLCTRDQRPALARVTAVTITILRTESNTVPCLANIKIFGMSNGLKEFKAAENQIIQNSQTPENSSSLSQASFFGGSSLEESKLNIHSTSSSDVRIKSDDADVPEEFLDSITQTLMLLPMALPSGHHVDRSTVDRCGQMFASWGGQPRDPFTGRLFSESHQPVFNAALKARIDKFSLSAPARGKEVMRGQTLGDAKMIQDFLEQNQDKRRFKRKLNDDNGQTTECDLENCINDEVAENDDNCDLDTALFKSLSRVKRILK